MNNNNLLYLIITVILILFLVMIPVWICICWSIRKRRRFRIYLKTGNMQYYYAFNAKAFRGRNIRLDEFLEKALEESLKGEEEKKPLQETIRRLKGELRKIEIWFYRKNLICLGCRYDDGEGNINNLEGEIFNNRYRQNSDEWLSVKIEFRDGTQDQY